MTISDLKIGYVPCSEEDGHPGDVRRFAGYAKYKGLDYEIANPNKDYDFVVLTQLADLSVWKNYSKGKIFFDFIDSYLAVPRSNFKQLLKGIYHYITGRNRYLHFNYWKLLSDICKKADGVICSTIEQKKTIEKYSTNVHVILDMQEDVVKVTKNNYVSGPEIKIVWEGLPSNLPQLMTLKRVLTTLQKKFPIKLVVITDNVIPSYFKWLKGKSTLRFLNKITKSCNLISWSSVTLSADITSCDLAVIPLDLKNPFSYGKPENKLLLFWRMGMPVVVSGSPAYLRALQAINHHELGCSSEAEWIEQISRLIINSKEREKIGTLGKDFCNSEHSTEKIVAKWDGLFLSAGIRISR